MHIRPIGPSQKLQGHPLFTAVLRGRPQRYDEGPVSHPAIGRCGRSLPTPRELHAVGGATCATAVGGDCETIINQAERTLV